MRSAAVFLQAGRAALLVASPPLAHGERAGAEEPGGGLDAALADRGDQPQAVIVGASHFTNQIEVAGDHRAATLAARAARLLPLRRAAPPQTQFQLHSSLRTHTQQFRQGVTMSLSYSISLDALPLGQIGRA